MNFNIGDRVIAKGPCANNSEVIGLHGTIVAIQEHFFGVEWDEERSSFHFLGDICEERRGWWVPINDPISLYEDATPHTTKVERKCKKLWNNSKFVQNNPKLAY